MDAPSSDLNATNPYLRGPYAPVAHESFAEVEILAGELPADLDGVFVRNGPNPKFAPRGRYHWFDGDGMLHAVHLRGGRARYRSRWIQTVHLAEEEAAGQALWRGLLEPTSDNPRSALFKDSANTDVVLFGHELLATWYICGLPYRVDPITLETLAPHRFGAERPRRISAHAKVDPVSGELCFFAYGPKPSLDYGVVSAAGELIHSVEIPLPGPRLPHDMAITEHHAVLMDLPVFPTEKGLRERRWQVRFHPDVPARFGIVPRRGDADEIRWFEAAPCYIYHVVNAWEEGSEVVMVGCRVEDPTPPAERERDGIWARMMANLRVRAKLHRWRFDLATGNTREEVLDDRNTEFPALNMGRLGRPSRFAYNVSLADTPTLLFDGLVKYDLADGATSAYSFGPGRFGSEPGFAPRAGADGRAGDEDDGYLVSFVHDQREDRSELLVFDARDLGAGPCTRLALPERVPLGFHACWVPGAAIAHGG
ncbi:carotenoid oxygenase family protein [Haliangium sp.]|uniref:carotenoid oxygenase family protein n=1 Tax=Haliangium sp. TaxID=2663208 RepID=UPI003D14FC0F